MRVEHVRWCVIDNSVALCLLGDSDGSKPRRAQGCIASRSSPKVTRWFYLVLRETGTRHPTAHASRTDQLCTDIPKYHSYHGDL
jgi:hypothetical protein